MAEYELDCPLARTLDAWSIHVPLSQVNERLVNRVHADNRKIFVFTANDRAGMDRLQQMGVDGIFSDYPDRWTSSRGDSR